MPRMLVLADAQVQPYCVHVASVIQQTKLTHFIQPSSTCLQDGTAHAYVIFYIYILFKYMLRRCCLLNGKMWHNWF